MLPLRSAKLPVRDAIDPHVYVRGIARYSIDKPKARRPPGSAVVSCISGHAPGVRRRLDLLEQQGMLTLFAPEEVVQSMRVQRLAGRGSGTQAVVGNDKLAGRVVLAPPGHQAFGGSAFALILACAILLHHRFRQAWTHCTAVRREKRRTQQLMSIGDAPIAVDLGQPRGAVHRLGGNIPCAIAGESIGTSEELHRCQRLAALQLPNDTFEPRAEGLRGHWGE
jgi:hypothetical protein